MTNFDQTLAALRVLRDTDLDTPQLTADQYAALAAFPGWGAVAPVFDHTPPDTWTARAAKFASEVGDTDLTESRRVVDTSFYTPAELIGHMWNLLAATGFERGRVLDIGCGTGHFLTHCPDGLAVDYVGIDSDPVATAIARLLHPAATIHTESVEDADLGSAYAAAIGNVPFGSTTLYEGAMPGLPLHSACIRRACRSVRPGGYVVQVTSRHVLDSRSSTARSALARFADLVAAIRLPSGYFRAGGTDVVADVLVLRVRPLADQQRDGLPGTGWPSDFEHDRLTVADGTNSTSVSGYWRDHPELVCGTMAPTGYNQSPLKVSTDDASAAVAAVFAHVAATLALIPSAPAAADEHFADVVLADAEGRPERSFQLVDGTVFRVENGTLVEVNRPSRELKSLIELRDSAEALLRAEADWDQPDTELDPMRQHAATLYAAYVDRFGPLNRGTIIEGKPDPETGQPRLSWRTPTMGGFRRDPGYVQVLALEEFDRSTGQASPAPLLSRRVNRRPEPVTSADSAGEALAVSLGESRRVNLTRIASLLSLDGPEAAFAELGDLVYRDPATKHAETARDYLSGDVRSKLAAAKVAAVTDPAYLRNVEALAGVQPEWLTATDIRIELGSPLLSAGDIAAFCDDVFGRRASITYEVGVAHWSVDGSHLSAQAQAEWGTPDKNPFQLLEAGLNSRIPTVTRDVLVKNEVKTVKDQEATEAAVEALGRIAGRFSTWVWEEPYRAKRLEREYNHRFNALVAREPNGDYLPFPRLAEGVQLWPWQRAWVDHALSVSAAFCGHEVGLGKTKSAVALAVTLREMGLASCPMVAVPNHLIEQISSEALRDFPSAKFLIVTRDDLKADSRRLFAARCATGDWDAVIITHEGFTSIPANADAERAWLETQKRRLELHKQAEGYNAKATARAVRSLDTRLAKLRARVNDPNTITFDQLGVDHISVDEADRFRRLPIPTNSDGFSFGASQRATDLLIKVWSLRERNPGKPCYAAYSGTPWNNSLAEAYVALTYCAPELLESTGLEAFDAWSAQFVRYETLIEMSPDGSGFRSKRRPSVIQNLPELRTMLRTFMHIVRSEAVGIERPEARFQTIVAEPSAVAEEFMASLVARADDLRKRRVTDPSQDNMLKVCNDGRLVALDVSLVGLAEDGGTVTKLAKAADNIAGIHHAHAARVYPESDVPGAFQFVACDLGTPHPDDAQTYGRLRSLLIERGVPASQVRFIHEATTPKAREALFSQCRSGAIAVLVGSTAKCGYGTNFQKRLTAIHHLDLPWHAAAWEQRNGRGLRFGNHHETVDIFSYVTERTFDGFMAGTVERKARGFAQLYDFDSKVREIDDCSSSVMTFAEVKAAASGNDLLLRQHTLQAEIRKLEIARVTTMQNARLASQRGHTADQHAHQVQERIDALMHLVPHAETLAEQTWSYTSAIAYARAEESVSDWRRSRSIIAYELDDRLSVFGALHKQFGGLTLQIKVGRSTWSNVVVSETSVPGSTARRTVENLSDWLADQTRDFLLGIDAVVANARKQFSYWDGESTSAYAAAAAVVFDRQDELDELRTQLGAVDSEIAQAVDNVA